MGTPIKSFAAIPEMPVAPNQQYPVLTGGPFGLSWQLPLLKHRGQQLVDVMVDDPEYIKWCCENIVGFVLTEDARKELMFQLANKDDPE